KFEMTRSCEQAAKSLQDNPGRRVVAGAFFAARFAVDASFEEARRKGWTEQKMIEPQTRVARPAVSLVIPECVDRLVRVALADRIIPALRHKRLERRTTLRLDQRVLVPRFRR